MSATAPRYVVVIFALAAFIPSLAWLGCGGAVEVTSHGDAEGGSGDLGQATGETSDSRDGQSDSVQLPPIIACAATCAGCCDTDGVCRAGTQNGSCGKGGAKCSNCACMQSACSTPSGSSGVTGTSSGGCNPDNCPPCPSVNTVCCDVRGLCSCSPAQGVCP
jgi:hypothetical protein